MEQKLKKQFIQLHTEVQNLLHDIEELNLTQAFNGEQMDPKVYNYYNAIASILFDMKLQADGIVYYSNLIAELQSNLKGENNS